MGMAKVVGRTAVWRFDVESRQSLCILFPILLFFFN